jgi:hypothetical protein
VRLLVRVLRLVITVLLLPISYLLAIGHARNFGLVLEGQPRVVLKHVKVNTDMKKMIKEYGGKEKYASKKAKAMHEKKESKAMEKKEKMMSKKKKK